MQPCKDPRAQEVLDFWFRGGERRKAWFTKDAAFDAEIRARFLALQETGASGALRPWMDAPGDCLALVIVLDQFPRNLWRSGPDAARAFASDALALEAARHAIERAYDRGLPDAVRMFFYLPFEHSERLEDQERALQLFAGHPDFEWARRHWEIIRRFARFPHRNAALGRESTPEELEFLSRPGSSF
jgi:uncharacterized protein (DUF924 family)